MRPIQELFQSAFGRDPDVVVQAPGRINLIGEHVDYLDGFVMPAAIERSIFGAAAKLDQPLVRIQTALAGPDSVEVCLDDLSPKSGADSWLNYIIGVLALKREAGIEVPGFEVVFETDLPTGAGLSSSAALETATALIVEGLTDTAQTPVERALLCQQAEHEYAGVPCGIMDQLAVGASQADHALMIDCRDQSVSTIPIPEGVTLIVTDSRVKHALADGEYGKRRADCEKAAEILGVPSLRDATLEMVQAKEGELGDRLFRRARHAVTEIARVGEFATALRSNDEATMGAIMRAGHESLRDDFEVSCEELDALVEFAYDFGPERGLLGSRMTGGGFGGSTVSLVRTESAEVLKSHLQSQFEARFNLTIEPFVTRAAEGAKILSQ